MATYSDHNGYFIMVVSVAVQTPKLCPRMCLMCAAVAHASKENQLWATRADYDLVILPGQSEKNSSARDRQKRINPDAIAQRDIVIARTTKGQVCHTSSIK